MKTEPNFYFNASAKKEAIVLNRFRRWLDIFLVSTKLGLTSFGGPVAHLGYFHNEYVKRRKWITETAYSDLIALCQFLPGPASSQVGISIGMIRGGMVGGFLSWLGFTFPSALLLILFAMFMEGLPEGDVPGWIQGLKIVAVAVVAHAVSSMAAKLAPDRSRMTMAIAASIFVLLFPTAWIQILVIVLSGLFGFIMFRHQGEKTSEDMDTRFSKKVGLVSLTLFFLLLIGLPFIRSFTPNPTLDLFDVFYRVGSIVYGGGHVVLPLLEKETVPLGWLSAESFLAGYGAAQAVPGPLFTLSAYIGAVTGGISGGMVATVAMFLPSFFLVYGILPFWNSIRKNERVRAALMGINAAVVGILLAALYNPVFTSAIKGPVEFSLSLVAFLFLAFWKWPAWAVVVATALAGQLVL